MKLWPLLFLLKLRILAAGNGEFQPREETARLWTETVCKEKTENTKFGEE